MKVGIIGLGKVGGSLAFYFKRKDIEFYWWTRTGEKQKKFVEIVDRFLPAPEEVIEKSELTFICIKDDEIENFLRGIDVRSGGKIVHVSGTLGLYVFEPLKKKGFKTGSLHPIQTFAKMDPEYLKNIYASFVGDEEVFVSLKEVFGDDLRIIKVDEAQKFIIHLGATISSNFMVFLLEWSEKVLKKGGVGLDVLFPLVETTFANIKKDGTRRALTGPAKRRDFEIIAKHEKYLLDDFPEFLRIYLEITRHLLKNGSF